jgi:CRISPR-associated protein Cas4
LYDKESKTLVEWKNKVVKIYDGYRYQVYAQYFCLIEMGFSVKKIVIRSLSDNKNYPIKIPTEKEILGFENLLEQIRTFKISQENFKQNPAKCQQCIYRELCDSSAI